MDPTQQFGAFNKDFFLMIWLVNGHREMPGGISHVAHMY